MLMSQTSASFETIAAAAKSHDFAGRAVVGTDAAGTIVYWNETASSLYGRTAGEAMGKNVVDVTPTETSPDETAHIMEHVRAGRDWAGEFMVRRRDGTPVVMHV
ncbi:MAG TPA: PAS domain-containing protein, partial [Gemmatimonadaceae bacterium]|nr:PAS domain-containing protein [Gemmatimonadaceae bacterium]